MCSCVVIEIKVFEMVSQGTRTANIAIRISIIGKCKTCGRRHQETECDDLAAIPDGP